jgi:hypothetical protein
MLLSRHNSFSFIRAALLFGVLSGLLFSYGEGIQLLPFPTPEIGKNSLPNINCKNKIPYQFSIHRFENQQSKRESKSRSDNPHHFRTNGSAGLEIPPFIAVPESPPGGLISNSGLFRSGLRASSKGSRAPPLT